MFGKKGKQTSLEKFVMRKGLEAGNLKRPWTAPTEGKKASPAQKVVGLTVEKPVSRGKANPVKIT